MGTPETPEPRSPGPLDPEAKAREHAELLQQALAARVLSLEQHGARGANWFYWVAALSLVNSILVLTGAGGTFIVGLGVTLFVDAVATGFAQASPEAEVPIKLGAFAVDLVIAAIVAGFGWLSRRRISAVFAIGMVLYLLDGLLYVWFQDWICVAFHAFVLWCMWSGLRAYQQLKAVVMELQSQPTSPGA